jgi:hypothetical protein
MLLDEWFRSIWALPWIYKLFFLFCIGSMVHQWVRTLAKRKLQQSAETWPSTKGRVVGKDFKEQKQGEYQETTAFVATARYNYQLNGPQSGTYSQDFDSKADAYAWLDRLYGKEVPVRYDPVSPSRSTLLERDLASFSTSPAAGFYRTPAVSWNPVNGGRSLSESSSENRGWLLELLSMTGLGICLIVHVAAFAGAEFDAELRKNVLVGMQLFAMAVYGFSMTLDRSFREGLATQRYRKEIGALTPLGFKVAQRLLTAYALALLGVVFYRILVMHQNSEIDPIPLFSAFQAMFLLEAFRMTQVRGWRATGHTVF